ncbi:glycosyltransferase family 4 protein [Clostridioides difficile]
MKVKIALISEALGGGVRRHLIDLMKNLDKNKFDIYFLYNDHRADEILRESIPEIMNLGVNLIEVKNMNKKVGINDIFALRNLYRELKKINPDIVHCHSSKAGVIGRVASKMLGIKNVYYTPHAYAFQNPKISVTKQKIYIFVESILSKFFTTKTINVSSGEKKFALKFDLDKEEKFEVIYNGIEKMDRLSAEKKETLKREFGFENNEIIVGSVSRIDEQKDPNTFFKISKEIVNKYKNVKFVYVGDGNMYDSLKERLKNENLDNSIFLIGFRKDVSDILEIFDILLTTALYEGMPYVLIEALVKELPIVATNTTGNNELVNNSNGLLFEAGNVEEGVDCISELIESKDLINSLGINSLNEYNEKFTIEEMIKKYEKLYSNL